MERKGGYRNRERAFEHVDLYAVHSQHVLHRDLKPENILLTNDDHIKVILCVHLCANEIISDLCCAYKQISDFGMAFPYENDDLVATTAGTAAFMAPEMCSGA